jgi:M6 family metalloprotease-like protein
MDYDGKEIEIGDQLVLDEALKYLAGIMDLSEFDSDGNGMIDSVVLITTLEIDSDVTFNWAYRYWNLYTDDDGYYYEYDEVSANDYLWAPYQFLYEGADAGGNAIYNDTSAMNTYTFIHEFGHVLGADDYYDTAYVGEPLQGCDIMDSMTGDHNPYSKFNYGWITTSRLIVTDSSVTVNLKSFVESGDTVIIANNWDNTLGAYQEYYVLMYYKNDGLNGGDYGYFMNEGIVVYHVNSTLYKEVIDGETYYDVYNNNTDSSDEYGSVDNLIELVSTPDGDIVFTLGDSLGTQTDDLGNTLGYTFTVDAITAEEATITFTKK